MFPLTDESAFAWIASGREPQPHRADSPAWKGNFVGHCIPRIFAAYGKIFHPIYEDAAIHDHTKTWEEERQAAPTTPESAPGAKALAGIIDDSILIRRGAGVEGTPGARVLWRTLAERYGLVFNPAFNAESFRNAFETGSWPRYLIGPTEGGLDRTTCGALIDVLAPFSRKQTIFFRFSNCLINDLPHLYAGSLAEPSSFLTKPQFGTTPEYWWPEDTNWCVCTDWDLTFTLIGGSRSIVDVCLGHPILECIEVEPETRIDYRADSLNPPKSPTPGRSLYVTDKSDPRDNQRR